MLRVPLLSATLLLPLFLAPAAAGGVNSGTLRGVTRDAEGTPLGGVVVLAYNLEGKGNRSIVSDREGVYALENVAPGHYQLAAARAGFIAPPDTTVALEPGESLRVDITLASSPQPAAGSSRNAKAAVRDSSPNAASASLPLTGLERELLARLNVLEKRLAVLEARESNGGPADRRHVLPHATALVRQLQEMGVPIIYFGTDSATLLTSMQEMGAEVIASTGAFR